MQDGRLIILEFTMTLLQILSLCWSPSDLSIKLLLSLDFSLEETKQERFCFLITTILSSSWNNTWRFPLQSPQLLSMDMVRETQSSS